MARTVLAVEGDFGGSVAQGDPRPAGDGRRLADRELELIKVDWPGSEGQAPLRWGTGGDRSLGHIDPLRTVAAALGPLISGLLVA